MKKIEAVVRHFKLEDIKNGASVRGVASSQPVHVISVDWIGDQAINVVYRDHNGTVAEAVSA